MNNFGDVHNQTQDYQNLFNITPNNVPISTNKWVVNSLQEALQKYAPPNSRGVYHSSDGEYEFEIYTDRNGIKSYDTYKRSLCTKEYSQQPLTQSDIKDLLTKIKSLEEKINGSATTITAGVTEMPGSENGESDKK